MRRGKVVQCGSVTWTQQGVQQQGMQQQGVACGMLGDQVRAACGLSTTCVELGGVITALYVLCCTVNINVLYCTVTVLSCTAL